MRGALYVTWRRVARVVNNESRRRPRHFTTFQGSLPSLRQFSTPGWSSSLIRLLRSRRKRPLGSTLALLSRHSRPGRTESPSPAGSNPSPLTSNPARGAAHSGHIHLLERKPCLWLMDGNPGFHAYVLLLLSFTPASEHFLVGGRVVRAGPMLTFLSSDT